MGTVPVCRRPADGRTDLNLMLLKSAKVVALIIVLVTIAACSTGDWPGSFTPATLPAQGNAAQGKALFQAGTLQATACSACHVVDNSPAEQGPSLVGVATRAESGWSGHSATDYLFRAIVYPNAHIVSGYSGGLMPSNYGQSLNGQQIQDLIAYLLTLK